MLGRTLFSLALGLGLLGPAAASSLDAPDARLNWRLGFGGATSSLQTGYALTVGYHANDPDSPAAQLLELDVSGTAALARLAGLPLFERGYRSNENDDVDDDVPSDKPWFARQWVWWTAGGLAATTALVQGGGGDEGDSSSQDIGVRQEGICVMQGGTIADNPVPEACTPEEGAGTGWTARTPRTVEARDPARHAWLDAGTGHMGDLIAR